MKTTIAILAILLLVLAGAYTYEKTKPALAPVQTGKIRGIDNTATVTSNDIVWNFENMGEDTTGMPSTKVSVTIQQNTYPVGTYQGSCSIKDSSNLATDELSGVLCWYAGAGDEVGVYREGDRLLIKHRQVDEGTAEADAVETSFETVLML